MVDFKDCDLSVIAQTELLEINRSGLYYRPVAPSADEVAIKNKIDETYTRRPFYGSRRIAVELAKGGLVVNRKAVQRHMHEMGITAVFPGPNLSRRALEHRVFPYLLRGVVAKSRDHIWGIDITYIRLQTGWLYLVAILDWFSRYIVSWQLDDTLEIGFVLDAVDRALDVGRPSIWNSDQGSHFTCPSYVERLRDRQIAISMDGKGRALDNIFTERLWRTIKYEEVYLNEYPSPREARRRLSEYISFYNAERPHQSLGYRAPAELYLIR